MKLIKKQWQKKMKDGFLKNIFFLYSIIMVFKRLWYFFDKENVWINKIKIEYF